MGIRLKGSRQSHGFSLIEMAIVLVIVMTVLTLGLGALSSVLTSSAYSETKARQTRIKDALIAYLGANKRLPCPAWGRTNPTAIPDMRGVERKDAAGVCVVDPSTSAIPQGFGVIPYAALGIGRDVAEDGWGNLMSYQVYFEAVTGIGNCTTIGTRVDWTARDCFGAGKRGGLWVYDGGLHSGDSLEGRAIYNAVATPNVDSRAVVVIVSHGKNGLGAWSRQGTQNVLPPATSCEERLNANRASLGAGCVLPSPTVPVPSPSLATTFIVGERPENDDLVTYLSADDMIQTLAKQGTLLSATAQVSEDLRVISYQKMDEKVSGGCLSNVNATSVPALDPWGTAYAITNDATDISHFPITICSGTTCRAITKANFNSVMNPIPPCP